MNQSLLQEGVSVQNAGLVILNVYFNMLFERLGLLQGNQFKNNEAQLRAVHYLQYIATGQAKTEEHFLQLNKLFCGIDLTTPIKEGIEISDAEKELIEGMISASIVHWPAIGGSSIDGFRGNWLVRDGILREEEDRWELTVKKRVYDILMLKLPFSFSVIKMPWMKKPLYVNWLY